MEESIKQRLESILVAKGEKVNKFSENNSAMQVRLNRQIHGTSEVTYSTLSLIMERYPDISAEYITTGNGDIFKSNMVSVKTIPIMPISAQGGSLTDFETSISNYECERIISPIKDAELAIAIKGHSMEPEYPEKSIVFVKRVNERAFIEWGEVYVLSTVNGTVIKQIEKSENDDYIKCVPLNIDKRYSPFDILKSDILGYYKVLMCTNLK
jgi:phage repressor protein C with HTH and peptisase S24 domain